jgi:hypothetical protein
MITPSKASLGAFIGGFLERPQKCFPSASIHWQILRGVSVLPSIRSDQQLRISWFAVLALFAEASHFSVYTFSLTLRQTVPKPTQPLCAPSDDVTTSESAVVRGPRPLRQLFTFPVMISLLNHDLFGFLHTALSVLLPLFLAMPTQVGGLELEPPAIGAILAASAIAKGLVQVSFFTRYIRQPLQGQAVEGWLDSRRGRIQTRQS